jgi:hypothetical protein
LEVNLRLPMNRDIPESFQATCCLKEALNKSSLSALLVKSG